MATYENQVKIAYLSQYRNSKKRCRDLLDEIEELRTIATRVTVMLDSMPGGAGGQDKVGRIVSQIVDLQNELAVEAGKMRLKERAVLNVIDEVDDPVLQELLVKRYINTKSWEKIAVEMHYSFRHTLRLHGAALAAVKIKMS